MSLTGADARSSLVAACRRVGIRVGSVETIRIGSNAVFRLDGEVIGRVAPDRRAWDDAERQIRVARWLERVGYPVARPLPVEQPIDGAGRAVTLWRSVCRGEVYAPIGDVARLIRELHALEPPHDIAFPPLRPFGAVGDELPDLRHLSPANRGFLDERIRWARVTFPELPFVLPPGVVHGDANVGNVLRGDDGGPVLIDLDGVAVGPREWDLVQTALFSDRLGWHTADEYREFVRVYGYDLTGWEGYTELADMREIAMTTWLGRRAGESATTAAEVEKRITALRTGASRRGWRPF
ncbi:MULTISPECIES: aminoglycoside phosphotransferase family protein [unclassified Pseudonocardia]|uniref:phosphotransferase enzyme family protein n=1 Tax=unclassified Pseudonocardia TaxID=2619320 RepID=UPI0001FFED1D|nr:aminoglycoside phosphotransferase family protein [Pseudonocardia sp. Ae707_Ps1]OLM16990.1 hypothetical protein Ae707Ps1_1249 [Pseudonocardia sp. Ae707_Ps1]